uniref:Uncharacterized protein n=1 Tax=Glossina pallidipes TaxID=7398 RepID=A0A1A9ZPY5_GLOPL
MPHTPSSMHEYEVNANELKEMNTECVSFNISCYGSFLQMCTILNVIIFRCRHHHYHCDHHLLLFCFLLKCNNFVGGYIELCTSKGQEALPAFVNIVLVCVPLFFRLFLPIAQRQAYPVLYNFSLILIEEPCIDK